MQYLSGKELSEKWRISRRRIVRLAQEGRIEGARLLGKTWIFPENAEKPADGRKKKALVNQADEPFFRYPIFEHQDLSTFSPPLSPEELTIKESSEAFHAGHFEEANDILGDLPETTQDFYTRLNALHAGCYIDIFLCRTTRFFLRYGKLREELQKNFPHKREMEEYVHEIDATLGTNDYYFNRYRVEPGYPYHESFFPHLASLGAVFLSFANDSIPPETVGNYEVTCCLLQNSNAYVDLQSLHLSLGNAYALMKSYKKMTYHFREALLLAEKYDLFYAPALQLFYIRKAFESALLGFSEEFRTKLEQISDEIHRRYLKFTDTVPVNSVYNLLPPKDFPFLFSAIQGYSNKETATFLHVSEGTVSKRYGEIYAMLGINGKPELIRLYRQLGKNTVFSEP